MTVGRRRGQFRFLLRTFPRQSACRRNSIQIYADRIKIVLPSDEIIDTRHARLFGEDLVDEDDGSDSEDEKLKCFDTIAVAPDPSSSASDAAAIAASGSKPSRNSGKKAKKNTSRADNMTVD
ncbi:hypothetical protein AX14_007705 [Amanita brunnescens Koide BX004]|nr:hypothetical protein AX14_007705 [Amanita brunnescens Koide BX004]